MRGVAHRTREALRPATAVLVLALASATVALAAVPSLVSYQGKLVDSLGAPVADGSYSMEFFFYDDCTAGNLLLQDAHASVATTSGIYSLLLGSGTVTAGLEPDLTSVFANHDVVCLAVSVEGEPEMTPRQQVLSAPYAMRADFAENCPVGCDTNADVTWTGDHVFEESVSFPNRTGFAWDHETGTPPPAGTKFRLVKARSAPQPGHPNDEADEYLSLCYNCPDGGSGPENPNQQAYVITLESNYWDGLTESVEYNWNYYSPSGAFHRPFINRVYVDGPEADRGYFHFWAFNELATRNPHLEVETTGVVRFSRGLAGTLRRDEPGESYINGSQSISHITDIRPSSDGGDFYGFRGVNDFDAETPGRTIGNVWGAFLDNRFTGTTEGRRVTGGITGLDVRHNLLQTGDCPSGPGGRCSAGVFSRGIALRFNPTGSNLEVPIHDQIVVQKPGNVGSDTLIRNFHGLRIESQYPDDVGAGFGDFGHAAILVESQAGSSAVKGNVWLEGGNHDDGHLAFGPFGNTRHLWVDSVGSLRYKAGVPTSETDGKPLTENSRCFTVRDPVGGEDLLWFRAERALTLTGIDCIVGASDTAVVRVRECGANAGGCQDSEAAIACGTTNATETGGIDDPAVDAGDWMRIAVDNVTGIPGQVAICVTYLE